MNYNTLLAVTSWESRFNEGIENFLIDNSVSKIILFDFVDYAQETVNNTINYKKILEANNIKSELIQLKYNDSVKNWKIVANTIKSITGAVVIDISTMPRDIIYFTLYHAEQSEKIQKLYCLYNCPKWYSEENWLTKDPCKPQLIYNMSGIFEMGKDTVLIVLTGFDRKRVEYLINYNEPRKIYLGLQTGDQYQNNIKNVEQYIKYYRPSKEIEYFDLDTYRKGDNGFIEIEKIIIKNIGSNIIAASLGPKPSSMALFRLNKKYQNVGLIYVPVKTYNMDYSSGIDHSKMIFEQIK
jgi:hypothetical protein